MKIINTLKVHKDWLVSYITHEEDFGPLFLPRIFYDVEVLSMPELPNLWFRVENLIIIK